MKKGLSPNKILTSLGDYMRKRKTLLLSLSAMVVFVTTYMLILPALTLEEDEAVKQGGIDVPASEQIVDSETSADTGGPAFAGDGYSISLEAGKSAKLPEGTELTAEEVTPDNKDYEAWCDEALKALQESSAVKEDISGLKSARFYDITLLADGSVVEPKDAVGVTISYDKAIKMGNKDDVKVIHFGVDKKGNMKPEVLKDSAVNVKASKGKKKGTIEVSDVAFDATGFSMYGVVEMEVLEKTIITADGKNYKITVTYDQSAGIPEGSELDVREIGTKASDYDGYVEQTENALGWEKGTAGYARLFDITILDSNGNKVEIAAPVDVKIELSDSESEDLNVVHFGQKPEVLPSATEGKAVSFEAKGFSIYAIVDSSKRLLYNFYDKTSLVASEYIKKQDNVLEELYDPGVEPEYGQKFMGWAYTRDETDLSKIYTIEQLNQQAAERYSSATEELTEIDVYAIYDEAWYLRYMDQDAQGNITVLNVVRVLKDADDKSITIDYTYTPEEGVIFEGWKDVTNGQTYHQGDTITLDHHVDLYLKVHGRNWLVFDSNAGGPGSGATYTPPQLLIGDDATTMKPDDPVRRGYTFTGWNTRADGRGTWWYKSDDSVNLFGNSISSDTTLYAQWEANDTAYYVVFWKQKATDAAGLDDEAKQYDYVSSEQRTAKTGATVNITNADRQKGGTANREYGYYFTYNENNSDVSATVDANGTTVLNVYYDRREITYNFTSNRDFSVKSYTGVVDGQTVELTPDGHGGYTYQKTVTETTNVPYTGSRYNISNNDYDNNPQKYIVLNGNITSVYYARRSSWYNYHWYTTNYPNGSSATYDYYPRYIINNTGSYGWINGSMTELNSDGTYTTTTTVTTTEPYTGDVTESTTQTRSASYTGLYGSAFTEWPNPGNGRVWQVRVGNQTLSLPLALTLFDPQAALTPNATQTSVNFNAANYSTGHTMIVYTQTTDGEWIYSDENVLTTANLGESGNWYPTETFEGFTVDSYQIGNEVNPDGTWTSITSSDNFSFDNNVFLRYSRNQHKINFISQGSHVTERVENTVEGVYYESDLSRFAEGGSNYYEPENGMDGYYFAGWYADADCQVPFDFNTTMLDSDITVYAKWDTYRVRTVLVPTPNNEHNDEVQFANNQALSFRLDYNEEISDTNINSDVAKRAGYKLIGWYYSPDFDPETEIHFPLRVNKDTAGVDMNYQSGTDWDKYGDNDGSHDNVRGILKLYAKWELDVDENSVYIEYDVDDVYRTYDTAGMLQTTIPVDNHKYALTNNSVTFQVAEAPTEYTSGFEFYRWVLLNPDGSESTTVFSPADTASEIPSSFIYEETITDDLGNTATIKKLRLKARFNIETEKVTTVTFDGNGGVTNDNAQHERVTESYPVNKDFLMKDGDSFVREGYTLLGWAFQRNNGSKISAEQYKNAIENMTPEQLIQAGIYQLGQEVAADNLRVSDQNNWDPLENTVYAVWEPNKFTITVKKIVDGENPDTTVDFGFDLRSNSEDFEFNTTDANFSLKHNETKAIAEVPYGTKFTLSETPYTGYIIKEVSAKQVSASDSPGVRLDDEDIIDLSGSDGKQYEVKGDIEIIYTNKKGLVPVVLKKVGYNNTDPETVTHPLSGATFKIHEGSINGPLVKIGSKEEFTSEGNEAVFFSGNLQIGVKYYLDEIVVPAGYNQPIGHYYFEITEDGATLNCDAVTGQSSYESWIQEIDENGVITYVISIRNVTGVELPASGGLGTHWIYILGSILLLGCGVTLIARRRIRNQS